MEKDVNFQTNAPHINSINWKKTKTKLTNGPKMCFLGHFLSFYWWPGETSIALEKSLYDFELIATDFYIKNTKKQTRKDSKKVKFLGPIT